MSNNNNNDNKDMLDDVFDLLELANKLVEDNADKNRIEAATKVRHDDESSVILLYDKALFRLVGYRGDVAVCIC